MATFIYRCPTTGLNVQGWLAAEPPADEATYEPVKCLLCNQMNFVNPKTGKTIGQDDK